jgi:hypothetical protein
VEQAAGAGFRGRAAPAPQGLVGRVSKRRYQLIENTSLALVTTDQVNMISVRHVCPAFSAPPVSSEVTSLLQGREERECGRGRVRRQH